MTHITVGKKYLMFPNNWKSLKPYMLEKFVHRLMDINIEGDQETWDNPKGNWFNINRYISITYYPNFNRDDLYKVNYLFHCLIRAKLIDIVFQSLICHGLLSDFKPNKEITDNNFIESNIGSKNDKKKTAFQWDKMKKQYFTGSIREKYENDAYYFVTGTPFGKLAPIRSKDYPNFQLKYFDFLTSQQRWTFMYAMNWVSQINFYHHYINCRVLYVTGATGVGKSSLGPPLLMYGQKMLDYNPRGKIVCTQPRIPPTVENAENISKNMGVPIRAYDELYDKNIFTSNYYIQYKHQKESHVDRNTDSFLRIVTDGTLVNDVKRYPFFTRGKRDLDAIDYAGEPLKWVESYSANNIYDIVIVDEAHEHGPNMDIILTLVRGAAYVNNSIKLVIISATMEDDEPIYRRYYRLINDNRAYPLSAFIENNRLDRANMDRRIDISPPGATTQFVITDHPLPKEELDLVNEKNFVEYGIKKTIEITNSTTSGDILLFMTGQADVEESVKKINAGTPDNIIAFPYYSEMSEENKKFVQKIHQTLASYTRYKEDINLEENDVKRRVPKGTYTRAIIIATNVAEASITLERLRYVIDTGYAKVNIYDPIKEISVLQTQLISRSSSMQRRGRVGRVASGDVYYLYDKDKVYRNKTAYKIADSDIKDLLVDLMKIDPKDNSIITMINDINYIGNLQRIMDRINKTNKNTEFLTTNNVNELMLLYELFENPRPYLNIIKKYYMYFPDTNDASQFYVYFGKSDLDQNKSQHYENFSDIKSNFESYLLNNHDDYQYQLESQKFRSRCFTGFDSFVLEDNSREFYIIHPDENVIQRDPYNGEMIGIKYHPSVSDGYYYYLLKANDVPIDKIYLKSNKIEDIDFSNININFDTFVTLKFDLAINNAKLQLFVMETTVTDTDIILNYKDIKNPNIKYYLQNYCMLSYGDLVGFRILVKSNLLSKLKSLQTAISIPLLNDFNNLLWYVYSIPHSVENDVVAVMLLAKTVPDIAQWINSKNKFDMKKFMALHSNPNGDIYFLWNIWTTLKEFIVSTNLLKITKINNSFESVFELNKDKYFRKIKLPYNEFLNLDKLYKSGKLNVSDNFFNYAQNLNIDFESMIREKGIDRQIEIIASNLMISSEKLKDFVSDYLDTLFTLNKNIWLQEYKIKNNMEENENEEDIINWAKQKLAFSGINKNPNYTPNTWDYIIEAYIRAFSINLLKNEGNYYLKMNQGTRIDQSFWLPNESPEKTLLDNKTEYLIYHSVSSSSSESAVVYLTPVKFSWVIDLNPIYYYYYFYDRNNILFNKKQDIDVRRTIEILNSNKYLFNINSLIIYLDQLNIPSITKIVRRQMISQKN